MQLADYLKSARPALYAEPSVRFADVSAQRQLGFANVAQRYYLTLRGRPESDPWRECAETEQWLAKPADLPPTKTIGACRPASEPPQLDGNLDEACWKTANTLSLRASQDEFSSGDIPNSPPPQPEKDSRPRTSELRLAFDEEYLYIAVKCPKVAGSNYRSDARPRPRDADLREHDRLTLRLDVDRDYSTAFELSVDARGWTHDACWGDAHWNPSWYVAAASDDSAWTVEAAVPLAELTSAPPSARHVWAVAARRTIPRVGHENWAADNSDESPAQFGLLIFE
jgi:hypothetical protein